MNRLADSPWLPRASCSTDCVVPASGRARMPTVMLRLIVVALLAPLLPLLAVPAPRLQRGCCRLVLWCFGVRLSVCGGPLRTLRGVLVVSAHVSWLDVFVVGAVSPGSFVARADLVDWPAVGRLARFMRVIPIDRAGLRRLPGVIDTVAARLRAGATVVAFPEGTTWCGRARGRFYPALFQAAVDAARPVQPLTLTYHRADGASSTLPAFVGDDTLASSMRRLLISRRTLARVRVAPLQLPGADRRELARRCQVLAYGGTLNRRPRSERLSAPVS